MLVLFVKHDACSFLFVKLVAWGLDYFFKKFNVSSSMTLRKLLYFFYS